MTKITFKNLPDTTTPLNASNLNTLQDNVENAINTVAGDIPTIDSSVSTSSTNGVENQAITNYVDSEISGLETTLTTITEGTGTPNSTYVSSVENNKWTRYGDIVCFGFIIATNNTWDLTSVIFTGLPKAKNGFRFMGLWADTTTPLRLEITENGELKNSWGTCPTGSQTVEAYVSYITKD